VILEGVRANPQVEALLKANEAAEAYSSDEAVATCPLAKKQQAEQREPKPPLKALMWHIRELGGGFQSPEQRADYCIEAYAAIIKASQADVVILAGLTRTVGWKPVKDGNVIRMEEAASDSGLAEVRRLAAALGSGWQWVSATDEEDKPVYHEHQTAAFLYNSARGITCDKVTVAKCGPAFVAIAPMQIPETLDAPANLPLLVPLRVGPPGASREQTPDPSASGALPPAGLVGFSAPNGLNGNREYGEFRSACDVEYVRPLEEGSVLKTPFWEQVAANQECLIENHMALNPADVVLQDQAMGWEALPPEPHPNELDKVSGRLADSLLVRKTGGVAPRLEKLRILDLVRASLESDALSKLGKGPKRDEDSVLIAQRKAFAATLPKPKQATPETAVERQIAEAALFVRKLSNHWPVFADVYRA
jgi:hypothetical protein